MYVAISCNHCSNKAAKVDQEIVIIRKYWEMILIMTDKSEENIRELFVHKTHITIMDIIGEGTLSSTAVYSVSHSNLKLAK